MKKSLIIPLVLCWTAVAAQDYQARAEYGQNLEPFSVIMHGAGQDPGQFGTSLPRDGFQTYAEAMDDGEKPMSYMYYENLSVIGRKWAPMLRDTLRPYRDELIVVQFGLDLFEQTVDIPTGLYDKQIGDLLDGIEDLGLPVYLRIGYEFNGVHNDYTSESYKASFIYIANKIRERNLEVATVWNFLPDEGHDPDFMSYYPGDEYVDWWSLNYLGAPHIGNDLSTAYLDSAEAHGRPVLIGESTPKDIGVLGGQASWDAWFQPFFDMIASEPGIKMTGYINWDWSSTEQWPTWGDARIQQNETVRQNFADQMDDGTYFHAGPERAWRELLGAIEADPPAQVQNIVVDDTTFPGQFSWDPVEDDSGIARYKIYDFGRFATYTGRNEFSFDNFEPGDVLLISVSAVDRAGNEGPMSAPKGMTAPLPPILEGVNLVKNPDFDEGTDGWELAFFAGGARGLFEIDDTGQLDGPNSGHVTITENTGTNFHIMLQQPFRVTAGHHYAISYQAKTTQRVRLTLETWFQRSTDPFTGYAADTVNVESTATTYRDTAIVTIDDHVFLRFMMGESGLNQLWFDSVSVVDLGPVGSPSAVEDGVVGAKPFELSKPYPNPARAGATIAFQLPQVGDVRLEVFNILGQRVAVLADDRHSAGSHAVRWDGEKASSGVYLVQMTYGGSVQTKKVLVQR